MAALKTSLSWVRVTVKESSDLGLEGFLRNGEKKVSSGTGGDQEKSTQEQKEDVKENKK